MKGGVPSGDADWARALRGLRRRISQTHGAAVVRDKAVAANWRNATFRAGYLGSSNQHAVRAIEIKNGKIATATAGGEVFVQSLPNGSVHALLESPKDVGELTAMDFDGINVVAGYSNGVVAAWDIFSLFPDIGRAGADHPHHLDIDSSSITPASPSLLGAHSGGMPITGISLCSTSTTSNIASATDFPPVLSCSADGLVRTWGMPDTWHERKADSPVVCVDLVGDYVIAGTILGDVVIWPKSERKYSDPILGFRAHGAQITAMQSLQDEPTSGDVLLTGGADGLVKTWDLDAGGRPLSVLEHGDGITSIQSDNSKVVSAGLDNTVRVWEAASGKELYRFNGDATDAISARFEGEWLVWNGVSRSVLLFDYGPDENAVETEG